MKKILIVQNCLMSYESQNFGYPSRENDIIESVNEVKENISALFWRLVLCKSFSMGFICYPLVIPLITMFLLTIKFV